MCSCLKKRGTENSLIPKTEEAGGNRAACPPGEAEAAHGPDGPLLRCLGCDPADCECMPDEQ